MMKFFDIYPENFFSVFTSPNKDIYVEALFVLRRCYQQSTVVTKDELLSSLVANLENQIFELKAEEGVLSLEDNLSARAHFLNIDHILQAIDKKNSAYTRASQ